MIIKYPIHFIIIIVGILCFQCGSPEPSSDSNQNDPKYFKEASANFPITENLRKWDAPVIADLDQDGFQDVIINDHGFGIRILWNNNSTFSKPWDLLMGDSHGVSVGDFDNDNNLELAISRGGGSGSNARNVEMYQVNRDRTFEKLDDFKTPLANMRGRTVKFFDGDNDGDLDLLDFAFPSKEYKGMSENYVYENDEGSQLVLDSKLPASKQDGQKTLVTDFNNDNDLDIVLYGHGAIRFFQGGEGLSFKEVTGDLLSNPISNVTGIVELDFDNDGDFDLFLTRGKDFKPGETYFNEENATLGFYTKRGPFQLDDLEIGDVLEIENYQSQWPNKDIFLGESAYKYAYPGETHSGRDVRLVNSDVLGWSGKIDEKGIYIGYVGNRKWRIAGDIWSPTTAVFHGVKSYMESEHEEGLSDILLENIDGTYQDATKKMKLAFKDHTMGAATADLDNNGFQDLIIVRRGELINLNKPIVFLNYGEEGFEQLSDHGLVSEEMGSIGMAIESLDFDKDGKQDIIIGNERGQWRLFQNTIPTTYSQLTINIGKSPTASTPPNGALVSVIHCGKSQTKRVGSTGSMYSSGLNTQLHFGLNECGERVGISVTWSDGEVASAEFSIKDSTTLKIGE